MRVDIHVRMVGMGEKEGEEGEGNKQGKRHDINNSRGL